MNSSENGEFQDENTGLSGSNQFLTVSPGGGKSVVGATQHSPLTNRSILKPSSRENLLQSTPSVPDKGQVRFLSQPVTANITPGRYAGISELDLEENWKERAAVVTKLDHEQYTESVGDILVDLVDNLPLSESEPEKLECEGVAIPSPPLPDPTPIPTLPSPAPLPEQDVGSEAEAAPLPEAASVPAIEPELDQAVLEVPKVSDPSPDNSEPSVECLPESQVDLVELNSPDQTQVDLPKPKNSSLTNSELLEIIEQPPEPDIQKPVECPVSVGGNEDAIIEQNELNTTHELKAEPETVGEQLPEAEPEHLIPLCEPTQTNTLDEQPLPTQKTADTDLDSLPLPASGAYNIDWDNFDENSNPFETKTKIPTKNDPVIAAEEPVSVSAEVESTETLITTASVPASQSTQEEIVDLEPLIPTAAQSTLEETVDSEPLIPTAAQSTQEETVDSEPLIPTASVPATQSTAEETVDSEPLIPTASVPAAQSIQEETVDSEPLIPTAAQSTQEETVDSEPLIPPAAQSTQEKTVNSETLIPTASVPAVQSTQEETVDSSKTSATVSPIQPGQKEDSSIPAVTESPSHIEPLDEAVQHTALVPSSPSPTDSTVVLESGVLSPEQEKIARLDAEISTHTESDLSTEQLPELGSEDLLGPEAGKEVAKSTMSGTVSEPVADAELDAIPIPKGAYNIDWDNFDDSINPFETKTKVGGAPKVESPNKKKTPNKNKTPKKATDLCAPASAAQVQPTKITEPNTTFTSSPAKSPSKQILDPSDINQNTETVSSNVTSSVEPAVEPAVEQEPREGGPHDLNQQSLQDGQRKPPAKKMLSGTRKVPKRFKPPAVQKAGGDEIEIFAPPPPSKAGNLTEDTLSSMPKPIDHSSPELAAPRLVEDDFPDEEFKPATAEAFIDPSSWDMLEKFGSTDSAAFKESALARQSLYVKFDPLVKGKSPAKTARIPSTEAIAEGEDSLLLFGTPPPNKGAPPKHPAARNLEARVLASDLPSEDTQPSMESDVDRMFSCSPGASEARQKQASTSKTTEDQRRRSNDAIAHVDIVQVLKYSQFDLNRIKKEQELDFQAKFLAKESDWQKERDAMQRSAQRDRQIIEHELKNVQQQNIEMKKMVADYEMTMTQMISDKESSSSASEQSLVDLVRERDTAIEDLHSVEAAFSDLHRRFEKSKAAIEAFKKNEETFKNCLAELQQNKKKQEEKYQALKKHAEDKLEQANAEIERIRKSTQSELTRLQAGMKRAEIQIHGLEQQVEQKVKENTELTAICDELINKVDQ